jgi:hypothetical protein
MRQRIEKSGKGWPALNGKQSTFFPADESLVEKTTGGRNRRGNQGGTQTVCVHFRFHFAGIRRPNSGVRHAFPMSGQGRDRTGDTRIFSPVLYQLSYLAIVPQIQPSGESQNAARE